MSNTAATFIAKSTIKAADLEHRRKINFNIGKYNAVVPIGKKQFTDVLQAREIAKNKKWEAIEHLDQYLLEFEEKITARGAKGVWAETAAEALAQIGAICKEKQCKTLVKSKSMVTEEIHLNQYLEENGIEKAKRECKTPISENLFVRSIDENESIELVDVAGTILNGFTAHLLKLKQ